jgi:PIN domain nuclease of toxin-antitoxin system
MNLLLDTHAFIWLNSEPDRLSPMVRQLGQLPQHHHDPFDRMIIAQAMSEGMAVVSADRAFAAYGVPVIW